MAKFTKTVDIWSLSDDDISKLQPGQWVRAGEGGSTGRFFGHGATTVVAWSARIPKGKRHFDFLKKYAEIGRKARNRSAAA